MEASNLHQQPSATVAQAATSCFRAFEGQLQQHASADKPRLLSLVMDQQARFSVWASNIRALSPGRASLDHRLREAHDVRDAIVGLLETLNHHIQSLGSNPPPSSSIPQTALAGSIKSSDEQEAESLKQIAAQITLLHRFSNVIRIASRETKHPEAAKQFQMRDEDGNDTEGSLRAIFDHYLQDRFPNLEKFMRMRLAGAMILQRKRVLYRRSRYGTASIKVPAIPPQPPSRVVEIETADNARAPGQLSQSIPDSPQVPWLAGAVESVAYTATTLIRDTFHKASMPSAVSASRTVATDKHERLVYPPAPQGMVRAKYNQIRKQRMRGQSSLSASQVSDESARHAQDWAAAAEAVGQITCPFCFHALPVEDVTELRRWERHVIVDLESYVCLFEDCDTSGELYSHSDAWLRHMSQHTVRWRCKAKSHALYSTASRDEYMSHMRSEHPGKFAEGQLEILSNTNGRASDRLFDTCPLCGQADVTGKMEDHVIGHLRLLGLRSLPPYQDEGAGDAYGSDGDSGNSTDPKTRSTVFDVWESPPESYRSNDRDAYEIRNSPSPRAPDLPETGLATVGTDQASPRPHICHEYTGEKCSACGKMRQPRTAREYLSAGIEPESYRTANTPVLYDNEERDLEWGLVLGSTEAFVSQQDDPIMQQFCAHDRQTGQGERGQASTPSELGPDEPKPDLPVVPESVGSTVSVTSSWAPKSHALVLATALDDLRRRVDDESPDTIESFGELLMHGVYPLSSLLGNQGYEEYFVYLFEDVLLSCRESDWNLGSDPGKTTESTSVAPATVENAMRLERKSTIATRSITKIFPNPKPGNLTLQVWWSGEGFKPGGVTFKFGDHETLDQWHSGLTSRLKAAKHRIQTGRAGAADVPRALYPDSGSSSQTAPVAGSAGLEDAPRSQRASAPVMMAPGTRGENRNLPPPTFDIRAHPRSPDDWLPSRPFPVFPAPNSPQPDMPPLPADQWQYSHDSSSDPGAIAIVQLAGTRTWLLATIKPHMSYEELMTGICEHKRFKAEQGFQRGNVRVHYKDANSYWVNVKADVDVAEAFSESPRYPSGDRKIYLLVTHV